MALLPLLLALPESADALTLAYESQDRRAVAQAKALRDEETSNALGVFDQTAMAFTQNPFVSGTGDQLSNLRDVKIIADGSAQGAVAGGEPASTTTNGFAQSLLDVTFSVSASTPYALTGTLSEFITGSGAIDILEALFVFTALDTATDIVNVDSDSTSDFSSNGTLAPGRYRVLAQARTSVFGSAATGGTTGDAAFSFTLIPEPATALLLAAGLAGLCLAGRPSRSPSGQ